MPKLRDVEKFPMGFFERQLKRIDSRMDFPEEVRSVFKKESVLNVIEVIDFIYFVNKGSFYGAILGKIEEQEGVDLSKYFG